MNVNCLERQKHKRDDGLLAELSSMKYTDHLFCGIHSYIVSFCAKKFRAIHVHRKKKNGSPLQAGPPDFCFKGITIGERELMVIDPRSPDCGRVSISPSITYSVQNIGEEEAVVNVFSRTPKDPDGTRPYRIN